jgi:hypothetical protein
MPRRPTASRADTWNCFMIFHSKNPLIEVSRSVREKAWEVRIRAKDDACGGPCYKGL